MKAFVWLGFDLGVRGDFEGMYEFLDAHEAKECGDSLSAFWFEYDKYLLEELANQLKMEIEFDKRSRVYVIYENGQNRLHGKFIIGRRKSPPWAGFGPAPGDEEDGGE